MKFTFLEANLTPRNVARFSHVGRRRHSSGAPLSRDAASRLRSGRATITFGGDLLASMRAKFNAVPLQTQKLADNVTKFSRSFLQDIFRNVSPKLGRTLTRQMLAKQLKQTTKTQGGVSSASLIWHQNIQLAPPGVNPTFHDVICVTSLENANENK